MEPRTHGYRGNFFFDSLKNVLKRGFYQEFVMTVKQTCLITLCSVFYLFTFKEAENYSRLVLGYTAALYLLISYVLRCLWKNCLRKYFGGAEKRSLLIVTVSDIVDTVIDNIKNKNYGDYFVTGVCILDEKAKGRVIDGVTVVADEDDLVEYVCREWVDEVFINIPESEPYPAELLDKFIEMGVVVHMKLAKSQNLLGKKQFVEHLGTYTVLTTSINSVSRRQIILKRMMDIAGGLAGCIITGILCIFVGPAIYIQSPGPIFFKQTRVGKNGKLFQMYKFRSMYMDAEERKAELMKENRVQDGMMFKLDFDPRIIGSKKLPDGTIKKGVGNFIRDWSLDEFPQFLNVLKGDMSLVGTRPPTVDEWDKYELHHRARLATKPGLTGMWQVSGRSNITDFEEVVKLDKQYISEVTEIESGIIYKDDRVTVEAFPVSHGTLECYGYKFITPDKTIVITGDTAPLDIVAEKAKDCDILLHEVEYAAGISCREPKWQKYHREVHTLSTDLAQVAKKANPKLLVTYHRIYHMNIQDNRKNLAAEMAWRDEAILDEIREAGYEGYVVNGKDLDVF